MGEVYFRRERSAVSWSHELRSAVIEWHNYVKPYAKDLYQAYSTSCMQIAHLPHEAARLAKLVGFAKCPNLMGCLLEVGV